MTTMSLPTLAEYQSAFAHECAEAYPVVDDFERRAGYAVDSERLATAARVLACPVKLHRPNWQHGRVLYAAARKFLEGKPSGCWTFLDLGTAKGFSALCLQWALMDHAGGTLTSGVTSVDVIDPTARVRRNTAAEVDGLKTLADTLAPWPEAQRITFQQSTGLEWLRRYQGHIDLAFVDGKHDGLTVAQEGAELAQRQLPGDLTMFDDVHIPGVRSAVMHLVGSYEFEWLTVLPHREYAIGVRR